MDKGYLKWRRQKDLEVVDIKGKWEDIVNFGLVTLPKNTAVIRVVGWNFEEFRKGIGTFKKTWITRVKWNEN